MILIVIILTCYASVNASYVLITGEAIYPGVTWNNLNTLIVVPMTLVVASVAFYLGKYVYE